MNLLKFLKNKRRVYLDYVTATPTDWRVVSVMNIYARDEFYNPGTLHSGGVRVAQEVREARKRMANIFGCASHEVIFTSGGTEANNLAIIGAIQRARELFKKPHIVTSAIEHPSVLEVCKRLEQEGVTVTYVPVDVKGRLDLEKFEKSLKKNTAIVSIMYVNNEIGTVEPLKDIAKIIRAHRKENNSPYPLFHTDATQAVNLFDINTTRLGVDLMTVSGAKMYGPKGTAVLVAKGNLIAPIMYGGKQEWGLRPGTLNVPLFMGFEKALTIAEENREKESRRLTELQKYAVQKIREDFPLAILNTDPAYASPSMVSISFPGVSGEQLVIELDARGIACSSHSICRSEAAQNSHVLSAIGKDDEREGTIRFSFGKETSKSDIDFALISLKEILNKLEEAKKFTSPS